MKYKWITKPSRIFLKNGYLAENESAESRIEDIANAASLRLGIDGFYEKFMEGMEKGWYLLSSPVWANFGKSRGLPISCFGNYISDTMESILGNLSEVGMMTKMGGGTSAFFGDLRPRGSDISSGGKSEGAVNFMRLFDTAMITCKQAAVRRGVMGCYLPIEHGDLLEFLNVKQEGSPIQDLFTGVCVGDQWMKEMIEGDPQKRSLWAKVLKSRSETGIPYIFFTDNANNKAPKVYKDKNRKVHGSNVCCVTADQRVPSQFGLLTVGELNKKREPLMLTDGRGNIVKSSPMKKLGENERVLKITLSNGLSHTVTENHKVPTSSGIKYANELRIGDWLKPQSEKGIFGSIENEEEAFKRGKKASSIGSLIPSWIWESTEETQLQYIKGLLSYQENEDLFLSNYCVLDEKSAKDIQIILSNLGCQSTSHFDHSFGSLDYYEVILEEGFVKILAGDCCEVGDIVDFTPKDYLEIGKIEYGGREDVYCVEVDTEDHLWVCNGIVTHNSEIMLSANEEESFVCCLSSMNLLHYEEWKDTDAVEILAFFLDAVLSEFIEKASQITFMERAVEFAKNQRAIGIGATGWHSFLQSKMIPFESLEAQMWNSEIFETMNKQSLAASKKAAEILGEPPLLEGYGERWVTRHAIAPNTSSAFVLGQVSQSIEPYQSNYYVKDLAKFNATVKNPYLKSLLKSMDKDTDEVWDSILLKNGSVQHLDFLTDEQKDVFRTFSEISPRETVVQAAQRQKFIDQGQSLNLMIPPDTKAKDINALIIFAWESGIKSLYYQKSVNAAQAFYRKLNDCSSCEG